MDGKLLLAFFKFDINFHFIFYRSIVEMWLMHILEFRWIRVFYSNCSDEQFSSPLLVYFEKSLEKRTGSANSNGIHQGFEFFIREEKFCIDSHLTCPLAESRVLEELERAEKWWRLMNAAIRSVYLSSIQIDSFILEDFAWISKVDDILKI